MPGHHEASLPGRLVQSSGPISRIASKYHPTWAPQTPEGVRQPLPGNTGWHRYEWTVPAVDTVHTLGVEVYSATDQPLILWLGAVSW